MKAATVGLAGAMLLGGGMLWGEEVRSDEIRLNQIQVIGTHNSYHIEPAPGMMDLIRLVTPKTADSIAYSHRPLAEQFGKLGIRQIELDLYADPEGGLFAKPAGLRMLKRRGKDAGPPHDPDGVLKKPGLKILHSPDFDFRTTSLTFAEALQKIRKWSQTNPAHVPIMVLVELKESGSPLGGRLVKFDQAQLDSVDREILAVFERGEILTPDDVRGEAGTLREVIVTKGWPTLDAVRGKVMFALDNGGRLRDAYVKGHPSLKGRLLFATVDEDDGAAAFFKLNDPVGAFDRIQRLVKAGFLVRTRADSGTRQARENDPSTRDRALASGAQYVSTDYPEPNPAFSDYRVRFDGGMVARANPVSGTGIDGNVDVEAGKGEIVCEGIYGGHLQGVATDGKALYWSHTVQLVKTDLEGKILKRIDVPNHHGDLTWQGGEVFVAVELGQFNQPAGKSRPWVYVYDAEDLTFMRKHAVPELVHGCGGIASRKDRFVVVGGLPRDHEQNYLFEYDAKFQFVKRHVLPSGQTHLGIQTAAFMDNHWWLGCYGSPKNPGLLKVDESFALVGQATTDFSFGIARLDGKTVLRGACFENARRGKVELRRGGVPAAEPVQVKRD